MYEIAQNFAQNFDTLQQPKGPELSRTPPHFLRLCFSVIVLSRFSFFWFGSVRFFLKRSSGESKIKIYLSLKTNKKKTFNCQCFVHQFL